MIEVNSYWKSEKMSSFSNTINMVPIGVVKYLSKCI